MYLQEKIHNLTFDLALGSRSHEMLHRTIYFLGLISFKVATSNGLGGDSFTRNVMDGRTHVRADRQTDGQTMVKLWYEINILFFQMKRAGIIRVKCFRAT